MKPARILSVLFFSVLLIACTASETDAQTVYITKTGKKYHTESCQYLRLSKYAIALKEAIDRNYTACSVCNPGGNGAEKKPATSAKPSADQKKSRQCTASTKAGTRCKRTTTNASGKCYQHE